MALEGCFGGGPAPDEPGNDVAFEAEVEIRQHYVAVVSDQHVFGLQISVNNSHHVQILQR